MIAPELLTKKDLAATFQVSTRQIELWTNAGRIPAPLRIGSHPRWPAATINAWLAAQLAKTAEVQS